MHLGLHRARSLLSPIQLLFSSIQLHSPTVGNTDGYLHIAFTIYDRKSKMATWLHIAFLERSENQSLLLSSQTAFLEEQRLTITDCRHVQFRIHDSSVNESSVCEIDPNQLQALFEVTAFWASDRSPEDWATAIAHSKPVVTVWDSDRLIGFARATSDGIYRATIWDVVIHPDYQGAGLGRKLVETVLMHPHMNRVERVYLMTTHQQHFYERIGFECNSSTTMVLSNKQVSQAGLPVAEPHSTPKSASP